MTSTPDEARLLRALDATWAPAEMISDSPWVLRRGLDGGKRVSAATTDHAVSAGDIAQAEAAMRGFAQEPIFMLRNGNGDLDAALDALGYRVVDPVLIFAAPVELLAKVDPKPLAAIPSEEPLALMREFWNQGGISDARIAVMLRSEGPKTYLFSRYSDKPAGAAFVAVDNEVAMLHALEVAPDFRRVGVARDVLGRAAIWGAEQGARFLSVVTTSENLPARQLFTGLGMKVAGKYHYRMK